ncbi:MAG: 3'-5' exonuclease, partial [Oligoflexia bacterium]|nr:3'-5' exonuclease [Oligoflexia bacterium]
MEAVVDQYVILDIETTGLDPQKNRIIEVGAIRIDRDLNIISRYHSLVNPRQHIPYEITVLTHGLNDDLVRDAPELSDIRDELIDFISGAPVIAHNASFEESFLKKHLAPDMQNLFMDSLEFIT